MSENQFIFDANGFLKPATFIELDLETFKRTFVADFPASKTRKMIFTNYLAYMEQMQVTVGKNGFYQWLDGSFVTQKENPNDLDIVTFLDTQIIASKKKELQALGGDTLLKQKQLDCYFVEVFPSTHKNYFLYQSDKMYWLHQFSYTKRNPHTDKRYEKGFIQLSF